MPTGVVSRAAEIMHHLEQEKVATGPEAETTGPPPTNGAAPTPKSRPVSYAVQVVSPPLPADPALDRIRAALDALDINSLSPVAALLKLSELQLMLRERKSAEEPADEPEAVKKAKKIATQA